MESTRAPGNQVNIGKALQKFLAWISGCSEWFEMYTWNNWYINFARVAMSWGKFDVNEYAFLLLLWWSFFLKFIIYSPFFWWQYPDFPLENFLCSTFSPCEPLLPSSVSKSLRPNPIRASLPRATAKGSELMAGISLRDWNSTGYLRVCVCSAKSSHGLEEQLFWILLLGFEAGSQFHHLPARTPWVSHSFSLLSLQHTRCSPNFTWLPHLLQILAQMPPSQWDLSRPSFWCCNLLPSSYPISCLVCFLGFIVTYIGYGLLIHLLHVCPPLEYELHKYQFF